MQKRVFIINQRKKNRNSNGWLVGFADLVALLLTFFVLIYATKKPDAKILEKISKSFNSYNVNLEKQTIALINEDEVIVEGKEFKTGLSVSYLKNLVEQKLIEANLVDFVNLETELDNLIIAIDESKLNFNQEHKLEADSVRKLMKLMEIIINVAKKIEVNYKISSNFKKEMGTNYNNIYKKLLNISEQLNMNNYFNDITYSIVKSNNINQNKLEILINK